MQEYSKIRTFLLKDNYRKPEKTEQSSDEKTISSCYVVIPVIAYRVLITKRNTVDNILSGTVIALAELYGKDIESKEELTRKISEKLQLDKHLVAMILKQHKENQDVETGEEKGTISQQFMYVLYDPIMKMAFPRLIREETYTKWTQIHNISPFPLYLERSGQELRIRASMDDSHEKLAFVLAGHLKDIPKSPYDIPEIAREYDVKNREELDYTGISETVGLICKCVVLQKDLSRVHVEDPVDKGFMDRLMLTMKAQTKKYPELNEYLRQQLDELEGERKRSTDEQLEQMGSAEDEVKQRILARYPQISQYPELWDDLSGLESDYETYKTLMESGNAELQKDDITEYSRRISIKGNNTLETVFAESLMKNLRRQDVREMDKSTDPLFCGTGLKDVTGGVAFLAHMAEDVGVGTQEEVIRFFESSKGRINFNKLSKILTRIVKGDRPKGGVTELVAANIIEAWVNEEHPFRKAIRLCPGLLEVIQNSRIRRNKNKHSSAPDGLSPDQVRQMYAMVVVMLEELLFPGITTQEQRRNEEKIKNRLKRQKAARVKADEKIKEYPNLVELQLKEPAKTVIAHFYDQSAGYMSDCSNLISELLTLLIGSFDFSQRKKASKRFSGDKWHDSTFIYNLLREEYGYQGEKGIEPNTRAICYGYNSSTRLSMKGKLYLSVALLDTENPKLLHTLMTELPDMLELINEVHVKRGHKTDTDFGESPDQYLGFHEKLMAGCEKMAEILLRGEEK